MAEELNILLLEDNPSDAELVEIELKRADVPCRIERVATKEAFISALEEGSWDMVLSDYNLPRYTGIEAYLHLKERGLNIPFILITGALPEETAIECIKEGVDDYILKSNLIRLPTAMSNALKKKAAERDKEKAFEALKEREERLRQILEQMPLAVEVNAPDGATTMVNGAFLHMFNIPSAEMVVGKFNVFKDALIMNELGLRDDVQRAFNGETVLIPEVVMPLGKIDPKYDVKDGQDVIQEITMFPVFGPSGEIWRVVTFFKDITERKKAEEGLIEEKEKAEKANHAKTVFLSHISHEFRTPLNAMLGFAQILKSEMNEIPERHKSCIEEIESAGWHLTEMVDEILELSTLESGKLSVTIGEHELEPIMRECLASVEPLAAEREIEIICRTKAFETKLVLVDKKRLKEVILNLLSNAIKFNIDEGSVTVRCEELPGSRVRISVTDTGIGITEEDQKDLFKPFSRIEKKGLVFEGTGIGLSISKHIMELLHGRIGVESQSGKGSTFWIELNIVK